MNVVDLSPQKQYNPNIHWANPTIHWVSNAFYKRQFNAFIHIQFIWSISIEIHMALIWERARNICVSWMKGSSMKQKIVPKLITFSIWSNVLLSSHALGPSLVICFSSVVCFIKLNITCFTRQWETISFAWRTKTEKNTYSKQRNKERKEWNRTKTSS